MEMLQDGTSRHLVAFDLETTGTDVRHDRIVEICLIKVDEDLNPQGTWVCRFNPGVPIPAEATAKHGITDADVADQPPFADWAAYVQSVVDGATLIAYNGARFDVPFLHNELRRAGQPGLPPTPTLIDPFRLYKDDAPRTMEDAYRFYIGEPPIDSHSAKRDCDVMLEILKRQRVRRNASIDALHHAWEKHWLDHEHRFYRDAEGINRFAFGKHRDDPVDKHPDYLAWMLDADFSEDTKAVCDKLLREVTWLEWEAVNVYGEQA